MKLLRRLSPREINLKKLNSNKLQKKNPASQQLKISRFRIAKFFNAELC